MSTIEPTPNAPAPSLAFVIPVRDAEDAMEPLYRGLLRHATGASSAFEVVFVDDGGADGGWARIEALREADPERVKAIRFEQPRGERAAAEAGWAEASGDFIFVLDADLRADPADIPAFLAKLAEGYDIVTSRPCSPGGESAGCGMRCYRRAVVKELPPASTPGAQDEPLGGFGYRVAEVDLTRVVAEADEVPAAETASPAKGPGALSRWFFRLATERTGQVYLTLALLIVALAVGGAAVAARLPLDSPFETGVYAVVPVSLAAAGALGLSAEALRALGRREPSAESVAPAAAVANVAHFPAAGPEPEAGKRAAMILVVDDDPVSANTVAYHLRKAGCAVRVAADCASAREELAREPDLVLLDLYLPDGDGLSLLREIRKRPEPPKVVLLSAESNIRAGVEAMRHGAFDYLCKPARPAQILAVIRRALESARGVAV